jgi:non-ribosomal peptide synthase protein (TIGR01720 family)
MCRAFHFSDDTLQTVAIATSVEELQDGIDLDAGSLIQFGLLNFGQSQPQLLVCIAHHLIIDHVSWHILMEDLELVYEQLRDGASATLPTKSSSFASWAMSLNTHRTSQDIEAQLGYWRSMLESACYAIPLDYSDGQNSYESVCSVDRELSAPETALLLKRVPQIFRAQLIESLLSALAYAIEPWTTEGRPFLVNVEGHGREPLFTSTDLSRTIGWFTSIYPVALTCRPADTCERILSSVKQSLRTTPARGIGFGILRYLGGVDPITQLTAPQVSFNYLGEFDRSAPNPSLFRRKPLNLGLRALQGIRPHLIDLESYVIEGRLQLQWRYSKNMHRSATVDDLADRHLTFLKQLLAACSSGREYITIADFPLVARYADRQTRRS